MCMSMPTPTVTPSLMMMGVNVAAAVAIPVVLVLLMVGVAVVVGAVCGGYYYMHYHKQGSELILFINFLLYAMYYSCLTSAFRICYSIAKVNDY